MEKSIRKILLAPYNLFDEVATANMGELSQFDVIVTNRQLSDEYETYCRNGCESDLLKSPIGLADNILPANIKSSRLNSLLRFLLQGTPTLQAILVYLHSRNDH